MTEKEIRSALNGSRNLFITGAAGTGKTYVLRNFIKQNSDKTILVCAPTGIAALNLNGDTMHRLFHIPVPAYDNPSFSKSNKKAVPNSVLKMLSMADVIIIDEISMCRNDVFRYAIKVLRKAEKLKGTKIRVIVSGDFSQLPPVLKKGDDKLLQKSGLDGSGFAFATQEWKSLNFKVLEFEKIYRQENLEFVEHLNQIRVGNLDNLDYFNQFVNPDLTDFEDAIYICGTNAEANKLNSAYLESLPGMPMAYVAQESGRVPVGIVDNIILLKPGARVIFTSNDNVRDLYRNGSFGDVVALDLNYITVRVGDNTFKLFPKEYPVNHYAVSDGKLVKKELGSVKQFPIKLAKAITIHRSQGQTFDKLVISPDVFSSGQLYVALSRVRDPSNMRLLRNLQPSDVIIDPMVCEFYANHYTCPDGIFEKVAAKSKDTKSSSKKKAVKAPAEKKSASKVSVKSKPTRASTKKKTTKVSAKKTTKTSAKKPAKSKLS